jgi:poly(3-hydroxybutyrate) depolymerase
MQTHHPRGPTTEPFVALVLGGAMMVGCATPPSDITGEDAGSSGDAGTRCGAACDDGGKTRRHDAQPDAGPTPNDEAGRNDVDAKDAASAADGGAGDAGARDSGAPGTTSFKSQATCSGSGCLSSSGPNGSHLGACQAGSLGPNIIGLGNVNNGVADECRMYGYYRPKNLVGKATAIFTAGGSGQSCDVSFDGSNWQAVADANNLVVIELSYCPRNAWYHPSTDIPAATGTAPSDGPYIEAVIHDAATNPSIDIDTTRMVLTGGSSGGELTWGIACDPTYSTLFQGYAAVSAEMSVDLVGGVAAPNTERCPGMNKNAFVMDVQGTADMASPLAGICLGNHCIASVAEAESYWAKRLGCGATPNVSMFGTPTAANTKDDFGDCGFGSPADQFELVVVGGGGHQWPGLDWCVGSSCPPTNGFNTAKTIWQFFSTRTW